MADLSGLTSAGQSVLSAPLGGSNVTSGVASYLGNANPFKNQTPAKYDPTAPAPIVAPTMAPGATAATVNSNGIGTPTIDPRVAAINNTDSDQFRQSQLQLANQLAAQASGQGPSIAVNTLRQGQEANLASTMAVLNSQRGAPNPAVARAALETNAEQQGQLSMNASTQRLQEQMQAAGMLNTVSSTARGQDIGVAEQQAQNNLQVALAQGQIDQNTYNQQMTNVRQNATMAAQFQQLQAQYAQMGMTADQANTAAALQIQNINANQVTSQNTNQVADNNRQNNILGQVFSGGATTAASMLNGGSGSSSLASGLTAAI